jgi:hypothetical protein
VFKASGYASAEEGEYYVKFVQVFYLAKSYPTTGHTRDMERLGEKYYSTDIVRSGLSSYYLEYLGLTDVFGCMISLTTGRPSGHTNAPRKIRF